MGIDPSPKVVWVKPDFVPREMNGGKISAFCQPDNLPWCELQEFADFRIGQ
jgi:hypothetical protein